jgi:hypothetical protein
VTAPKWTRREFARDAALLLAAAGCGTDPDPEDPPASTPTNIVFITADDLGWKDLSSYGLHIATPNIDRLVSEGVAFDRAFDVVSSCSSSRATFITGQYPTPTAWRAWCIATRRCRCLWSTQL